MRRMPVTLRNVLVVARREYAWRMHSRPFQLATLVLIVVAVGVALSPILLRFVNERVVSGDRIGVHVDGAMPTVDVVTALDRLLNVPDPASGSAARALTIQDHLARAGIPPGNQAILFAPAPFEARPARPASPTDSRAGTTEQLLGGTVLGLALTIFIFMAIVLYGQWVAMSVAEEKSSRVMESVLAAARPIELMSGKVVGVGALGLTQYVLVFVAALVAIVFQDRIAVRSSEGGPRSTSRPGCRSRSSPPSASSSCSASGSTRPSMRGWPRSSTARRT